MIRSFLCLLALSEVCAMKEGAYLAYKVKEPGDSRYQIGQLKWVTIDSNLRLRQLIPKWRDEENAARPILKLCNKEIKKCIQTYNEYFKDLDKRLLLQQPYLSIPVLQLNAPPSPSDLSLTGETYSQDKTSENSSKSDALSLHEIEWWRRRRYLKFPIEGDKHANPDRDGGHNTSPSDKRSPEEMPERIESGTRTIPERIESPCAGVKPKKCIADFEDDDERKIREAVTAVVVDDSDSGSDDVPEVEEADGSYDPFHGKRWGEWTRNILERIPAKKQSSSNRSKRKGRGKTKSKKGTKQRKKSEPRLPPPNNAYNKANPGKKQTKREEFYRGHHTKRLCEETRASCAQAYSCTVKSIKDNGKDQELNEKIKLDEKPVSERLKRTLRAIEAEPSDYKIIEKQEADFPKCRQKSNKQMLKEIERVEEEREQKKKKKRKRQADKNAKKSQELLRKANRKRQGKD